MHTLAKPGSDGDIAPLAETQGDKILVDRISRSRLFKDYETAYSGAMQLPLSFHPVETWNVAHDGKKHQNLFCALLGRAGRSCCDCLANQQKITRRIPQVQTSTCFAGLTDSTVPVQSGERIVGFLQTGQISLKKPCRQTFEKIIERLSQRGVETDVQKLEKAYFETKVLSPKVYQSTLGLLQIFSKHLSLSLERMAVSEENAEPLSIRRAKMLIEQRKAEDISMRDVARMVNVSTFYFCKIFKKSTGLTFTQYLSNLRIAKAKNLLLNPRLRVSEIAFDVGYQSLTHFNRTFHRVAGQSPSAYRKSLFKETLR